MFVVVQAVQADPELPQAVSLVPALQTVASQHPLQSFLVQVEPHPSEAPMHLPLQSGTQTHRPLWQTSFVLQVPQVLPQPSGPHCLPLQAGEQAVQLLSTQEPPVGVQSTQVTPNEPHCSSMVPPTHLPDAVQHPAQVAALHPQIASGQGPVSWSLRRSAARSVAGARSTRAWVSGEVLSLLGATVVPSAQPRTRATNASRWKGENRAIGFCPLRSSGSGPASGSRILPAIIIRTVAVGQDTRPDGDDHPRLGPRREQHRRSAPWRLETARYASKPGKTDKNLMKAYKGKKLNNCKLSFIGFCIIASGLLACPDKATSPRLEVVELRVEGMTCGSCEQAISDALGRLPGVVKVVASHKEGRVLCTIREREVNPEALPAAVNALGYRARLAPP